MVKITTVFFVVVFLFGCVHSPKERPQVPQVSADTTLQISQVAIDYLNSVIEEFNAGRRSGDYPIDRRVSQGEYDSSLDQVNTFDGDGEVFIILKRKPDGRFKGILEQPYHSPELDGYHEWGYILVEFYLDKDCFNIEPEKER